MFLASGTMLSNKNSVKLSITLLPNPFDFSCCFSCQEVGVVSGFAGFENFGSGEDINTTNRYTNQSKKITKNTNQHNQSSQQATTINHLNRPLQPTTKTNNYNQPTQSTSEPIHQNQPPKLGTRYLPHHHNRPHNQSPQPTRCRLGRYSRYRYHNQPPQSTTTTSLSASLLPTTMINQ